MVEILNRIKILNNCKSIVQDFSGYSSALRYICEKDNEKYFVKIYKNNIIDKVNNITKIYSKLNIPIAKIYEINYLEDINKTYVIYEYLKGDTLLNLTKKLKSDQLEEIGVKVGKYLSILNFEKCSKDIVIKEYDQEFKKLIECILDIKRNFDKKYFKKLYNIDLNRLIKDFELYKKQVYSTDVKFIHGDINLNNVIYKDNEVYFIDILDGRYGFRSLDFRGNCWFGWDGNNKYKEQAVYRGIYKGMFNGTIPKEYNQELGFTIIYEFMLKIKKCINNNDIDSLEWNFNKFGKIFDDTNYFENYCFEWFN